MEKNKIIGMLTDYNKEHVEKFASYCVKLATEKNYKTGGLKNPWMNQKTNEQMAELFRLVEKDGLVFDGVHITLQKTGVSYDYVAYKNKMLIAYPESKIDISLVYQGDIFSFSKDSGVVEYTHVIKDPFVKKDIIGGYCVIRNRRGDSLTLLSADDIDRHRKVAKTDFIWKEWFTEMAMKTVMKKACKQHFADIYQSIEDNDNENCDLGNPLDISLENKASIEAIEDIDGLNNFYQEHKNEKGVLKYLAKRKKQINSET